MLETVWARVKLKLRTKFTIFKNIWIEKQIMTCLKITAIQSGELQMSGLCLVMEAHNIVNMTKKDNYWVCIEK